MRRHDGAEARSASHARSDSPQVGDILVGAVFTSELVRVLPQGVAVTYPNVAEATAVVL